MLKKIREKPKYDLTEDDLIHLDDEDESVEEVAEIVIAKWNKQRQNYLIW